MADRTSVEWNGPRRRRSIGNSLLVLLGIVALAGFGAASVGKQLRSGNDFPIYYEAAKSLLAGSSPYDVATGLHGYVYLPLLALSLAPLAALPLPVAASVWFGLNLLFTFVSVRAGAAIVRDLLPFPVRSWIYFAVLIPLAGLFADNLALGQANLLILMLATLALKRVVRSGDGWVAGLLLGLAATIKPNMALLVAPLLIRRMGRAASGFVVAAVAAALLVPALLVGPARTQSLLSEWNAKVVLPARSGRLQGSKIWDQSPQAGLRRLLVDAPAFSGVSVNVVSLSPPAFAAVSRALSGLLGLGLVACWLLGRERATRRALLLDLALALCGTLLVVGFNLKAHFVALLVPGIVAIAFVHGDTAGPGRRFAMGVMAISACLLLLSNPGLAGRGISNWFLAYSAMTVATLALAGTVAWLRLVPQHVTPSP